MEFFNQWSNRPPHAPQEFKEPTCTVPNQSMTVQEIIAKYSRTGLVPQSFAKKDLGGNLATDPGFDPLDEGFDVLEQAARAKAEAEAKAKQEAEAKAKQEAEAKKAAEAAQESSAPAGDGGNSAHSPA